MKILVLVAHPDDEVIMCGATIDKLKQAGHQVWVSYYTKNEEAYFDSESQIERSLRAEKEALSCSKLLGFQINFLGFKDMHVEENKAILIKKTIAEIRRTKPDIILTHTVNDKHIDHRTLGEIVPEANFQSGCKLCGGTTTWSAAIVLHGEVNLEMTTAFDFQVVSACSEVNLKRKTEAFKIYESVMNEHGTEADWLYKKLCYASELRGRAIKAHYGEAFIINTYIPLGSQALQLLSEFLEVA